MRLFLYYFLHSFKNQIRKLFRTWVAILIVGCLLLGVIVGLGASAIFGGDDEEPEQTEIDVPEPLEPILEEALGEERRGPDRVKLTEAVAAVVILASVMLSAVPSDSSGKKLFIMADVNLLFSAPMKPQSVLLYRLVTKMGTSLLVSLYFLFQLPNLIHNAGIPAAAAWILLADWFVTLVYTQLISVLIYTLRASRSGVKATVKRILYGIAIVLVAGYILYWRSYGDAPLTAAANYLATPWMRLIPVWGWLKAIAGHAAAGEFLLCLPYFLLLLAAAAALVYVIWRLPADFYETAMNDSQEIAQLLQDARDKGRMVSSIRKKDRSETLRRDGLHYGRGGSVYFFKTMYTRFRFAKLHYFTGTCITYTLAAVLFAAVLRFVMESKSILPVMLLLALIAFFRALGDPLGQDTKTDMFFMIPEPPFRRVAFSLLGGAVNCLLDLLPGVIIACILIGGDPVTALVCTVLIVSVGLYASSVGAFISLSLPTSLALNIRNTVQILFIYFGILPIAAIIAVTFTAKQYMLGSICAALFALAITALFTALCSGKITSGRK